MKKAELSFNEFIKKKFVSIDYLNKDIEEKDLKNKIEKLCLFCMMLIILNIFDILIFNDNSSKYISYILIIIPFIYIFFINKLIKNFKYKKNIYFFFYILVFICYSPFILINCGFLNIIYKILSFILLIAVGPILNLSKVLLFLLISLLFNIIYIFYTTDLYVIYYIFMYYIFILFYSQILYINYKIYIRNLILLEKKNDKLLIQTETDKLTGLLNRYGIQNKLIKLISLKDFYNKPSAIMLLDIDFFKEYNDTFGHLKSDECLKLLANKLKSSIKKNTGFVSRFGGEEFLLYIFNVTDNQAVTIAERICKNIENMKIPTANTSVSPYVTISIGISMFKPNKKFDFYDLLKEADKQLYLVKNKKRNGVSLNNNIYY